MDPGIACPLHQHGNYQKKLQSNDFAAAEKEKRRDREMISGVWDSLRVANTYRLGPFYIRITDNKRAITLCIGRTIDSHLEIAL